MGAFRDFFISLYGTLIKEPLEYIGDRIGEILPDDNYINNVLAMIKKELVDDPVTLFGEKLDALKIDTSTFTEEFKNYVEENLIVPLWGIPEKIEALKPSEEFFKGIVEKLFIWLKPSIINELKAEIALKSLDPKYFTTDTVQKSVTELKEKWAHSPESASDIAHDLLDIVKGQGAKLQLEAVSGIEIGDKTPVSQKLFSQLGIITDITLLTEVISIIAEVLSIGQIDEIGKEIRAYLDYSGLTQITGFGYGMLFSAVLQPVISQEINTQLQNIPLDPERATVLKYRGIYDNATYTSLMAKHGFGEVTRQGYLDSYKYYPPVQDLIRFMVRDVFNTNVVEKYGYNQPYPKELVEYAQKAGVDVEWLNAYWYAHWELPSPTQAFEMLHRGKITEEDIKTLLKIADVAPYFIDPLIAIAYNPITRVDIRRIYQSGGKDHTWLVTQYKNLGSSPEDAETLATWTEQEYAPKERELAKEEVLKNYRIGKASVSEVRTLLEGMGYTSEQVDWILIYEDYKLDAGEITEELETVIAEVVAGSKTLAEAETALTALEITQKMRNTYKARAIREYRKLTHIPSIAKLQSWVKKEVITEKVFKERMLQHKVTASDIDNYYKEAMGGGEEETEEEEE